MTAMKRRTLLEMTAAMIASAAGTVAARAQPAAPRAPVSTSRYQELIRIPMRDGIHIAASLWLPEGEGPFPAIIMRSLARRRYSDPKKVSLVMDLIDAGYAFLGTDVRGRFESEGEFDPTYGPQEGRDGHDVIEWAATQPWCDGNIGTVGLSHQSYYQVRTAVEHPPHLKAIATWTGGFRADARLEGAAPPMSGGVTALMQTLIFIPNEAEAVLDRVAAKGEDVSEARRVLRRMRSHPAETYMHLPLREAPISQFAPLKHMLDIRLSRTASPALASPNPYSEIKVPAFHECGWFDPEAWAQFVGFAGMKEKAGTPLARDNQFMTAGPWQHGMTFQDRLGDFFFFDSSTNTGSGINARQIAFFDRFVRGRDVALPKIRYFVMGLNEWRTSDVWPPASMSRKRFYLHSGGKAQTAAGDGKLLLEQPKDQTPDTFVYDPENPVPTLGGSMNGALNVPGMIAGPIEQSPVEHRADVLCYTTAPFAEDTEVSGPVVANLFVSTSAVDTDFTAKLTIVQAGGRSYNLGDAIQRLSGRSLSDKPEPAKPGEVYELRLGITQTSIMVMKGQALRLQISSSNYPTYDRNMGTGNPPATDTHGVRTTQTIHHKAGAASYLELPMARG
jgi:putative CocE/NonD family hydrolase